METVPDLCKWVIDTVDLALSVYLCYYRHFGATSNLRERFDFVEIVLPLEQTPRQKHWDHLLRIDDNSVLARVIGKQHV